MANPHPPQGSPELRVSSGPENPSQSSRQLSSTTLAVEGASGSAKSGGIPSKAKDSGIQALAPFSSEKPMDFSEGSEANNGEDGFDPMIAILEGSAGLSKEAVKDQLMAAFKAIEDGADRHERGPGQQEEEARVLVS